MKELYVVLFEGKVRERESKREVKKRIISRFNIDPPQAERLFSGHRMVVFRSEERDKTDDFAKRFTETGALCRIEPESIHGPTAEASGEDPGAPHEAPNTSSSQRDVPPVQYGESSPYLALWEAYAGPRGDWYAERFKRFTQKGTPAFAPSWNWSAFLFGIVWLIYRKMYRWALLLFGVSMAGIVIPGGSLAISFFFGAFANFLYFLHVKKKVDIIISESDHIDSDQAIKERGGVNPLPKVLALFLLMMGIMALFGSYLFDFATIANI